MTCGLYVTVPVVYKTSSWELFFKMHNALTFKKILMSEGQFDINYLTSFFLCLEKEVKN